MIIVSAQPGPGVDQHKRCHDLGMRGGEQNAQWPPGPKPDNGGLFGTDCGHDRRNVRHPFIDNGSLVDHGGVGHAHPAFVEQDYAAE
jgi:hypothetical protein